MFGRLSQGDRRRYETDIKIMKKSLLILIFVCSHFLSYGLTFPEYMEKEGMKLVATLAHPGTIWLKEESKCVIYHNVVFFHIQYEEEMYTQLKINIEDGIMKSTELISEKHWFPVFQSSLLFEEFFGLETKYVTEKTQKKIREYYEGLYKKKTGEFNGLEMTTALLSYVWAIKINTLDPVNLPYYSDDEFSKTKMIDGIKVQGTTRFVERVEDALKLIKRTDPDFYSNYFENRPGKFSLIRGIVPNIKISSTIKDGFYIALGSGHNERYNSNANVYKTAGILIHEMVHLYQYYEYCKLFETTIKNGYKMSFAHDPIAIAKIEQEACEYQIAFLKKIKINNSGQRSMINNAITESKEYFELQNILFEGGRYLFGSRYVDPFCGNNCLQKACDYFKAFSEKNENKQDNGDFYLWMYCR